MKKYTVVLGCLFIAAGLNGSDLHDTWKLLLGYTPSNEKCVWDESVQGQPRIFYDMTNDIAIRVPSTFTIEHVRGAFATALVEGKWRAAHERVVDANEEVLEKEMYEYLEQEKQRIKETYRLDRWGDSKGYDRTIEDVLYCPRHSSNEEEQNRTVDAGRELTGPFPRCTKVVFYDDSF